MNLRSASLLGIVCTALALLLRLGLFAQQFLQIAGTDGQAINLGSIGLVMLLALLTDGLVYGALLVFFFAVRRSLGPDAGQ